MTTEDSAFILIIFAILAFGVVVVILEVMFFMALHKCLNLINPECREISPGLVWLNFIPFFSLGWLIYTVIKISASIKNQNVLMKDNRLNDPYSVGLAMGICHACSVVPYINFLTGISTLILGIIYWINISQVNKKLERYYANI